VSLLEKDIERRSLSIKKQTKPVSDWVSFFNFSILIDKRAIFLENELIK
jgi:hypothetical protein